MEIDPLEAVITWLEANLSTVGGRVAGKQRYGEGWTEAQTGVSVRLDGGPFELYGELAACRMEVGIFAKDQVDVVTIWRELVGLCRGNERFEVTVSGGTALVHYVRPGSALSLLYEEELRMERGVVFLESLVSEVAVS